MQDETEKCWLEYVEGYLTCTYNHTAGALCLVNKCPYCHNLECICYQENHMQDHIENNILPQKIKGIPEEDSFHDGYNQALSEVHAVLPQVIEYIHSHIKETEPYLKHGLFNQYEELVMKIESATDAHEIAKKYNLVVKELY